MTASSLLQLNEAANDAKAQRVEAEARWRAEAATRAEEVQAKLAAARADFERAIELWKQQAEERAAGLSQAWREKRREAKRYLREAKREWKEAFSVLSAVPQPA